MSNSVDAFAGSFKDFARSNRFLIQITKLNGEKLKYHAESADMPGSTMGVIKVAYRGRTLPIKGDREYQPWNVSIKLDDSFSIRKELYAWKEIMNTSRGNTGGGDLQSYAVDATCQALDVDGNPIHTFSFSYLWPSEVGAIQYSQQNMNQIAEVPVTFEFGLYESS